MNSIHIKNFDLRWHVVLILLGCVLFPVRAHAGFVICNDLKNQVINAAVGYTEAVPPNEIPGINIVGWYPVKPGRCVIVTQFITSRIYYVFAKDLNGRKWPEVPFLAEPVDLRTTKTFCTLPEKFSIPIDFAADEAVMPCRQGVREVFEIVDVGEGTAFFTYRITANGDVSLEKVPPLPSPTPPPTKQTTCRGFTSFQGPIGCPPPPPPHEAWQDDLNWSITNKEAGGSTNCPLDYPYTECIVDGGRSCLMKHAMQSARDNDCANAMRVALVTQCHNPEAQQRIGAAGQYKVCLFLGPPQPAQADAGPPPPPPPLEPKPHPITFENRSGINLYIYYFFGGTVSCQSFQDGGMMADGQSSQKFIVPAQSSAGFVFQKSADPCTFDQQFTTRASHGGNPAAETVVISR